MRQQVMVPPAAAERVIGVLGEPGRKWLRDVSMLVESLLDEWSLTPDGPPFPGGYASLVLPVLAANGVPQVMKLAPSAAWVVDESLALEHWRGRGAVRLERMDRERAAMLCERAIPGEALLHVAGIDDDGAAAIVGDVIAGLMEASPPAVDLALPSLESWTASLAAHERSPLLPLARAAARARAMALELHAASASSIVLHGDLHQGNVLRASRQPWLAIDPKGVIGPAAAEAAAFLRNPRRQLLEQPDAIGIVVRRIDVLAERLGQDARAIAGWAYVMAVLSAAWAVEDHEAAPVIDRAIRCAALLEDVVRGRAGRAGKAGRAGRG